MGSDGNRQEAERKEGNEILNRLEARVGYADTDGLLSDRGQDKSKKEQEAKDRWWGGAD